MKVLVKTSFETYAFLISVTLNSTHGGFNPMTKLTIVMSTALLWTATVLNAQSSFGTIAGLVRNPAKAPVAGAMVTATKLDGSTIRTTISGSDGLYTFSDVLPGPYSVVAQADGYPDFTVPTLQVTAGKATRADIAMTGGTNAPATISSVSPVSSNPMPQVAQASTSETVSSTSGKFKEHMSWKDIVLGAKAKSDNDSDPVLTTSLAPPPAAAFDPPSASAADSSPQAPAAAPASGGPQAPAEPAPPAAAPVDNQTPFAYGDFTWMNAVSRNHDSVLDGKYFSPEIRADVNYIYDQSHPIDHTLAGTTEGERTGEIVLQQLNVGGDFHWDHMQMRILSQIGATATAVPRNDASNGGLNGQWDLADAYRYITEGYAGYHMDVQHGLNIQAGIFMSFIGLYSYYSFDNWGYQPSYVSSNTPWFFTGFRGQWFPTNKLKIEPWLINGWQSYGKFNGRPGIGGQILWRPTTNLDFVWNTYGLGQDTLGTHRTRIHEDDSMEWKYWEDPNKLMHRMAFSFTWDEGCETGGGTYVNNINAPAPKVQCFNNKNGVPAQNFLAGMFYQRFWFDHDKFGATIGGGFITNPGRYLVLLPPINGATASTGTPYFTENPGQKFAGYDYQLTFDWMPTQFVTWRAEFTERGTNVPYWSGPGGMTPPGGNNGSPGLFVCNDGTPSATGACGADGGLWKPDLKKQELRWTFALMVHL